MPGSPIANGGSMRIDHYRFGHIGVGGRDYDADLIIFMPDMTGNQWFDNTDLPRSEGGLIRADRHCRAEGMQRVYVAGDSGSFPGPEWMPKQAHMADLQAEAAAKNLVAEFNGQPVEATPAAGRQRHGRVEIVIRRRAARPRQRGGKPLAQVSRHRPRPCPGRRLPARHQCKCPEAPRHSSVRHWRR